MTTQEEMRRLVLEAAGDDHRWKVRVASAARKLGMSFSRVKDIYYNDNRVCVRADELERARSRLLGADHERISDESDTILQRANRLAAELDRISRELAELRARVDRNGNS